jgi:antitoxin component YwqK of YwqJK toxin-antitoxin module
MKKLLPLLLLILIGCSEPEPLNYQLLTERDGVHYLKDTNEIYSGPVFSLYKNGQLKQEKTFKDGKEDGPWKYYYSDGQLQEERTYKNGKQDGPFKWYHKNGQLAEEGTFNNGNIHGPFKYYYENGQLKEEGTYKYNKLDGPFKLYHENGQLQREGTYKDGEKHGPWKSYYDNGQLEYEKTYKNDVKEVSSKSDCSIVDDWVYPNYENATRAFKFMSDKSFNYSSTSFSITRYGTWKKVGECTYLLTYQNGDNQVVSISNDMFYIFATRYIRY